MEKLAKYLKDPADPRRCQAITRGGNQCLSEAVPGGTNCMVHGGNKQLISKEQQSIRNYHLAKWQHKLNQKADNPNIKSLRDEIGILRIILEERLNKCQDATDLILQSSAIGDLVSKIERVVSSCHKLEHNMGQLLDKQAILQFASNVIGIISEVLGDDSEKINVIADRILEALNDNPGAKEEGD